MAPSLPTLRLMDLPSEVLELVLVAVADPWSLRSLSRTCRRLAAACAPSSALWRTLLATHVDLTPLPGCATEWETEFYCYWDESFGEDTDEVAFAPPLARVRGWMEGVLPSVPSAVVNSSVAQLESAKMVAGEAEEYGDPTRDGGPPTWETDIVCSADDEEVSVQEGADDEDSAPEGADDEESALEDADEENSAQEGTDDMESAQEDAGGEDSAEEGTDDMESVPEDADGEDSARHVDDEPAGSFLYVDNRANGTGTTAPGATAAAASGHPGGSAWEDDPHIIYTGLATLSRAAAAVHSAQQFDCDCGWGSEGDTQWHLLAVRTTPGSITWPAAGASKAAVVAAADALMTVAGADAHARARIAPRVGGLRPDASTARRPWSGQPARALFRTYVAGPAMRHVMRLEHHRNPVAPDEWFPAMRATHGAVFTAVEAVLGDRPVLAFHFAEEAMNPTGGVIAVQWSPSLVLGILMPIVHT